MALQNGDTAPPLLVAFGNPLLDITAVVKDRSLHDQFQLPVDGQLEVNPSQRDIFSHVMKTYPVEYTAGGCALNSSRVFCWVLGEPRRVVFVGGIGKDEHARRLSSIIQQSGVVTRFIEVEEQPTGACVALVLGACRCLCADIGAASVCQPSHVFNPSTLPLLEDAKFIYVEGYFITHSFPATLQIAQYAHKNKKTLVFNLCGSYVCENHPNELAQLLPFVHILFGFIEEYKTLDKFVDMKGVADSQHSNPYNISHSILQVLRAIRGEEKILSDGIKSLSKDGSELGGIEALTISNNTHDGDEDTCNQMGENVCNGTTTNGHTEEDEEGIEGSSTNGTNGMVVNGFESQEEKETLVVVTKGPSPLLYAHKGVVKERQVPPISPKDIIDTTGAGDSFVGGFLAALSTGEPLDRCLDCGVWTAQQLLQQKGCTLPSFPANFLSSQK